MSSLEPSRFTEVLPVTEKLVQEINQGAGNNDLFNLGRHIPNRARSCFFGFCDSTGLPCWFDKASHFGWTPFSVATGFVGDSRWVSNLVTTAQLLGG